MEDKDNLQAGAREASYIHTPPPVSTTASNSVQNSSQPRGHFAFPLSVGTSSVTVCVIGLCPKTCGVVPPKCSRLIPSVIDDKGGGVADDSADGKVGSGRLSRH